MFPNSDSNLSRINLSQQADRPVLTPEVPRLGCSSSLGNVYVLFEVECCSCPEISVVLKNLGSCKKSITFPGTINMMSTAGGQAAVPPFIVSHTTSANLFGMRPLLPIPNSAEQAHFIPDIHYRIRRNAIGCPRPLFSGMERCQWSSAIERSQFVRPPGSKNSRALPSLRDVSCITAKQKFYAFYFIAASLNFLTP
ncbi:hypothetical protein X798_07947 [Onchocerca flexuosa]|uniref:Uncharacterized protein n=1 Tax=Onchocerca flexuosa TaxID=387005 RepID=A0A238BK96_9BILA|nr:hypothetical protein X798_07947 [Onchocerca flexuosa]